MISAIIIVDMNGVEKNPNYAIKFSCGHLLYIAFSAYFSLLITLFSLHFIGKKSKYNNQPKSPMKENNK